MSGWEEAYKSVESLWGLKPDHTLVEYGSLIPKGKVLDLGIDEGRNALYFAKMARAHKFQHNRVQLQRRLPVPAWSKIRFCENSVH